MVFDLIFHLGTVRIVLIKLGRTFELSICCTLTLYTDNNFKNAFYVKLWCL